MLRPNRLPAVSYLVGTATLLLAAPAPSLTGVPTEGWGPQSGPHTGLLTGSFSGMEGPGPPQPGQWNREKNYRKRVDRGPAGTGRC